MEQTVLDQVAIAPVRAASPEHGGDCPSELPAADAAADATTPTAPWLIDPWLDSLFVLNLGWPLLAVALVALGPQFQTGVEFWQIHFLSTPHRWITLPLVFLDRRRFRERPVAFVSLAVALTVGCLAVRMGTGAVTCLLLIDYFWNAWHFAAQHSGILRIYARRSHAMSPRAILIEKILLRSFVCYVLLRVSGMTWAVFGEPLVQTGLFADSLRSGFHQTVRLLDDIGVMLAVGLVAVARPSWRRSDRPRSLYLASVLLLYGAILAATRFHRPEIVVALIVVMALFHASEYLAVVTWSAKQRHESLAAVEPPRRELWATIVPHWGLTLAAFCLALGVAGWAADRRSASVWLMLNLVASFLHYAYDGMIWKRRRGGMTTPDLLARASVRT